MTKSIKESQSKLKSDLTQYLKLTLSAAKVINEKLDSDSSNKLSKLEKLYPDLNLKIITSCSTNKLNGRVSKALSATYKHLDKNQSITVQYFQNAESNI